MTIIFLSGSNTMNAQDVTIVVPAQNIFNHTEYSKVQNVLYTNRTDWQIDIFIFPRDPTFTARSTVFRHRNSPDLYLPSDVLQYRLASIGGREPIFSFGDNWPGFKSFATSAQKWYEPSLFGSHPRGNIDFTFKISGSQFASNKFQAGNYAMEIIQNYDRGFFTPDSFNAVISIPQAISWLSANYTSYMQINSLDDFRYAPAQIVADLGVFDIGNTVNFKLHAKAASSTIQFTSSKGVQGTRNIAILNLGGSNPKINTLPLSASWKDFTAGNNLNVEIGNRNNFQLKLSLSQADFKTYFYEAGTYKFQLNLNAKSTDNTTAAQQNVDFTLNVLPLSEITIPSSGSAVNFEFNTVAHYQNGQTRIIPNQLRLSNNETYELYVKTDAAFFKRSGIQSDVPSSILQVGVDGGSQQVALSTTPKKILTNGSPALDKNLNIKYTIPANAAQALVAKEKSTYSINVIYSFTAL